MSSRIASVVIACLAFVTGCAPSTPTAPAAAQPAAGHDDHHHDHDHGDHDEPETVAEGLAQLEKLCADVKAHLATGDHEKADGPVHMVGHLLEDLGELVAKEKPAVEAEAKKALVARLERLMTWIGRQGGRVGSARLSDLPDLLQAAGQRDTGSVLRRAA